MAVGLWARRQASVHFSVPVSRPGPTLFLERRPYQCTRRPDRLCLPESPSAQQSAPPTGDLNARAVNVFCAIERRGRALYAVDRV